MLGGNWAVLIAGPTGSALRAVRPPNLHIAPDVGAISLTPRVRRVPCSARPWPSSPKPSARSYSRAQSRRLSSVAEVHNIAEQVAYLSRHITLNPGDVIATGSPAGVGMPRGEFLKVGDEVRIEIEGCGTLVNRMVADDAPSGRRKQR